MTIEAMAKGRRNTALAAVIGTVLASYAGGAAALEWEADNGTRVNWNTTLSVGSSWRSTDPSRNLYTLGDGSTVGKFTGPYVAGHPARAGQRHGRQLGGGRKRARTTPRATASRPRTRCLATSK